MKTALITGAARRIGAYLAMHLAKDGYDIVLHYHSCFHDAEQISEDIRSATDRQVFLLQQDLSKPDAATQLFTTLLEKIPYPPCLLINNASIFNEERLEDVTYQSWQDNMNLHAWTPLILGRCLWQHLPPNQSGHIINMIDQRIARPNPYFFSYTASKSLLWTVTQMMAMEMAPRVRVNAIAPGPILPSKRQTEKDFKQQTDYLPLKAAIPLEDIGRSVTMLDKTLSMTGQILFPASGQHLAWQTPDVIAVTE